MSTQVHPTSHFHITLPDNGETEENLEQKLRQAGIDVKVVRAVSALRDGISVTQLLAQGEWDTTAGPQSCRQHDPADTVRHLAYAELSPAQVREYHRDLNRAMGDCRANHYDISNLAESPMSEEFDGVALHSSS